VTTLLSTIVRVAVVVFIAIVLCSSINHVRAAVVRRRRREACPFEDDDHEARPLAREIVGVVREALAQVRLHCAASRPIPPAWRGTTVRGGAGPIVVLVAARYLGRGSLALLGRRLARDLDASVHTAPGSSFDDEDTRADRLADRLVALDRAARGRAILAIGHGEGGLVARRAAAALRLPDLRVVTLATAHQTAGRRADREPIVDRVDVLNLYSLHDAIIVPADRAYLASAYNVVVRDEGHFGIVLGARPYAVLLEGIAGLLTHAVAS
jgi:hypothetical protein